MTTPRLSGLSIAVLALLLAACGGAGTQGGSDLKFTEGFDACSMLSPQRARAMAGGKAVAGITSTFDDAHGRSPLNCPYNAGTIEQPELIGLEIRPAVSPRAAASRMKSARPYLERLAKREIHEVEGVGEEAYWIGGLQQLHSRKGSVHLIITVQAGEAPLPDAKRLAEETFAALEKAAAAPKKAQPSA